MGRPTGAPDFSGLPDWKPSMSRSRLTLMFRILPVVLAVPMLLGVAWLWTDGGSGGASAALPVVASSPVAPDLVSLEVEEEAPLPVLPEPTPLTREQKRFARADRDDDGRVSQAEFVATRRRNFDKLDANGDGRLSFEEYAADGIRKFGEADRNGDGRLDAAEFATTAKPPATRTASKREPAANCACS